MLEKDVNIWCGVFDSTVLRGNQPRSIVRTVNAYEIELFHTQAGVSHVNRSVYPTRRGMLLCAKPGQKRYSDFPVRCSFIRISPENELAQLLDMLPVCTYIDDMETVDDLLGLFAKLSSHCISSSKDALTTMRINELFWELLSRCTRICRREAQNDAKTANHNVANACEYIREHFRDRDCTLEKVANAVGLSRNRLHTLFRQVTGQTPFDYMISMRVEQAKRLIVSGEKTMVEIALETGFCSQSHFSRVFRRVAGVTPSAYRRKLMEQY